ncbi:MAG: hypothetical protein WCG48_04125 [Candidatus Berkelbacteria bacterium]
MPIEEAYIKVTVHMDGLRNGTVAFWQGPKEVPGPINLDWRIETRGRLEDMELSKCNRGALVWARRMPDIRNQPLTRNIGADGPILLCRYVIHCASMIKVEEKFLPTFPDAIDEPMQLTREKRHIRGNPVIKILVEPKMAQVITEFSNELVFA